MTSECVILRIFFGFPNFIEHHDPMATSTGRRSERGDHRLQDPLQEGYEEERGGGDYFRIAALSAHRW